MIKTRQINIIIILLCMIFLSQCAGKPEVAFKIINDFFRLKAAGEYAQCYNMFHENFQKDVSMEQYIQIENLYFNKFGKSKGYKMKKWNNRKNFSYGQSSGRMVAIIYSCTYKNRKTEETFTMLLEQGIWKIFDYYLRPM